MSTLSLHLRSFHSQANFGRGGFWYRGDDRGFFLGPNDQSVKSKIWSSLDLDLISTTSNFVEPESTPSAHESLNLSQNYTEKEWQPWGEGKADATPYREDGDQTVSMYIKHAGQNFAMPFTGESGQAKEEALQETKNVPRGVRPAINAQLATQWLGEKVVKFGVPILDLNTQVTVDIDREDKKAHISCTLRGDGFPDGEVVIIDSAGTAIFLATHIRVGSATGQLFGEDNHLLGKTEFEIDWNDDDTFGANMTIEQCLDYTYLGSPVDIADKLGKEEVSLDEWNGAHLSRDPASDLRKEMDERLFLDQTPGGAGPTQPGPSN